MRRRVWPVGAELLRGRPVRPDAAALRPGGFRTDEYSASTWRGVLGVGAIRHDCEQASLPAYDEELRHELAWADALHEEGPWKSRRTEDYPGTKGSRLRWGFFGWTLDVREPGHRGLGFGFNIAYWLLLLLCSVPPGLRVVSTLIRRRPPAVGCCPACGYDLRATPERCPECGRTASVLPTV
jgi:hypothetical protein